MPEKKSARKGRSPANRRADKSDGIAQPTGGNKGSDRSSAKKTARAGAGQQAQRPEARPLFDVGRITSVLEQARPRFWQVKFARADDLLVCNFVFENLKRQGNKVVRRDPAKSATLIVELPPQSFAEEAFLDATGPEVSNPIPSKEKFGETSNNDKNVGTAKKQPLSSLPSARVRMAGRTRLAFAMPATETELEFTAEALLDACRRWRPRLDVNATPDPAYDPLRDLSIFDHVWLKDVTSSAPWQSAMEAWSNALPGWGALKSPLTEAARRIAAQAAAASTPRRAGTTAEGLTRAMEAEINTLARRHPQLREGEQRDLALGVMSLTAAQVFAPAGRELDFAAMPFLTALFAPHQPSPTATAIELPYRLILSPLPQARWRHATKPVTRDIRTELWHTRLTTGTEAAGRDRPAKVRALWSPDYPLSETDIVGFVNNLQPFRASLDALDRQMLVKLMVGFDEESAEEEPYVPRAARAQRLALSALGGTLDVEGHWNTWPKGVGLEQWRHLATLGRDHYVRVVYRGFLCPFGHSASLIKVTERKFEDLESGRQTGRVAALRQRFFIVVREPVKEMTGAGHAFSGRNLPFSSVEILTRVTPSLRAPDQSTLGDATIYTAPHNVPKRACFWPMITATTNFVFQIAATDMCGDIVTFAMPLLFVGVEANEKKLAMQKVLARYNSETEAPRRRCSLGNANVCFAPETKAGDTRLPTTNTTFRGAPVTLSATRPRFYPELEEASVGIAAVQRLLNNPAAVVPVQYARAYEQSGFGGANTGEVYLKTLTPFELKFGETQKSDALGALVTPNMVIQGLSRIMGPVAAQPPSGSQTVEDQLAGVIGNNFNPASFFKRAKILGGVDLAGILGGVARPLASSEVPKLLTNQSADRIEARFDWVTPIKDSDPLKLFVPLADTELKIHAVVSSPIAQPSATTFSADATLTNFKVNLFGFITIWFEKLRFVAESGSKPDVAVDLKPGNDSSGAPNAIAFGGPLEFVNELRKIIPSNGFSDPPNLSVTPSGIAAGYSLSLPSVTVGIFALENVSIGCGFALPFDARPVEVRFNFSERQRPFSLTVSMLGGGGFFAIGLGTEGVREIEAALEFGARLSIDLGVASGSVEIKAGVYFHWLEKSVELAGYVRIHGELSVLGLISASMTFNLQLAYLKEGTRSLVWGEATLVIEVDVLVFSADVSVRCRREFGGSPSDPKFIELIPDEVVWASYCNAFAEE